MKFDPQIDITAGATWTAKIHHDTYPAIAAASCKQHGRAVLITGASKGVGLATAVAFAKAGAECIGVAARSSLDKVEAAALEAAKGAGHPAPKVLRLALDVSDERSVAEAASRTEQVFGRLDILVNNAGRLETWVPMADTDPASWWNTWEVNIKGTFLMTRAFLPLLLKGGEKTIVNMNSMGAFVTRPGASAYQTTKLAMLRLTEFTVAEYAAKGILAFAIHPGAVPTELAFGMPADTRANLVDSPELSADSIVRLTQDRQEWLNGRYYSANWDLPEVMSRKDEIVQHDKLKVRLVL